MNKKELVKYFYEVIVSENMLDELANVSFILAFLL